MNKFFYERIIRAALFRLDPEAAHHFAMHGLKMVAASSGLQKVITKEPDPKDAREVFGLNFPNAVGLAAGFDKDGVAIPAWAALGFGFIEIGTVTAKAQPGNETPRLFRYPQQQALINRMGFNNEGADAMAQRLEQMKYLQRWPQAPVGVNLGKSKVTALEDAPSDYLYSFQRLKELGDYFVINVSSPNTPGLRKLQDKDALGEIFQILQAENSGKAPLLVKIAPDLEFQQIDEVLELIETHGLSGIIATNTTLDHSSVPTNNDQQGGLSGAPLRDRSTEIVKYIAEKVDFPIIASGGIMDGESAREKMDAGASLVQVYSGFVYKGPGLIRDVCAALRS